MNSIITTVVFASMFALGAVHAHKGATGIVKERMDGMKEMSDSSKELAKMFKGDLDFNVQTIEGASELFVQHGRRMADLFPDTPQSREGHKTEALPKIWQQPEEFQHAIDEFIEVSESLKQVAASTTDERKLKKSFRLAAQSCKGCHKQFRMRKKK